MRGPRFEPEIEMKPQAVGVRHEEQREWDGEEEPEGHATVVRDASQVRQKKGHKKNGNDDHEREAIRDDHATDVVTRLAEEGKAAARARRTDFIRPASEHASLLAVGAAQAERGAKGGAKRRAACFLHLGQSCCNSVPPPAKTRENTDSLYLRLSASVGRAYRFYRKPEEPMASWLLLFLKLDVNVQSHLGPPMVPLPKRFGKTKISTDEDQHGVKEKGG